MCCDSFPVGLASAALSVIVLLSGDRFKLYAVQTKFLLFICKDFHKSFTIVDTF